MGNPGNGGSGDDENDNEDARTLNGTQILLKVSGTTATVENNNGCVEVADKSATITCPGAYYVTGESSDFQVVVNTPGADKEGNTGIYLNNATLKLQFPDSCEECRQGCSPFGQRYDQRD